MQLVFGDLRLNGLKSYVLRVEPVEQDPVEQRHGNTSERYFLQQENGENVPQGEQLSPKSQIIKTHQNNMKTSAGHRTNSGSTRLDPQS